MRRAFFLALSLAGCASAMSTTPRLVAQQDSATNKSLFERLTNNDSLQFDVQPRIVKKSELKPNPFRSVPGLKVLVRNSLKRPLVFGFGCGGLVPVLVKNATDQQNALPGYNTLGSSEPMIGCTAELRTRIIQPGETVEFPSFSWVNLSKVEPGKYVWVIKDGIPGVPFDLVP